MSIVFFGTPEFAVPSLRTLIASGESISLVVTQPDRLQGRGHHLAAPPVKTFALHAGLPVFQPSTLRNTEVREHIAGLMPEFIVVVAYGKILPKAVLEIPAGGCVNVHASLLPKYRGAAPIAWAIINCEEKTGVTTMLMDEGLDTGPVLLKREMAIMENDTAGTLGCRLAEEGAVLLKETITGIRRGIVQPLPQRGTPSFAPPLKKTDGRIDWSRTAPEISCFVRGMQPWPGAYCSSDNETVKIMKAEAVTGSGMPGIVARLNHKELCIGTGSGLLSVLELQPAGKRPMPVSAFLQGRRLREGDRLL